MSEPDDTDDEPPYEGVAPGVHGAGSRRLVGDRVADMLQRLTSQASTPGLYVVATPIGNLGDITLRALVTLAAADVIYCEDTRHSRTLLAHYGIAAPLRSYHEHNADAERPHVLAAIAAGKRVALISDAGTPLVSDPGYKLVLAAVEAGHRVTALPGACAAITALCTAGLPSDAFHFAGFLPARDGQRRTRLQQLAMVAVTVIVYEAPQRLVESLDAIASVMPDRTLAVARELTKRFEETRRGTAAELADHYRREPAKGEIVILIGPAPAAAVATDEDIEARMADAMQTASLRDAAKEIATALDVPKARAYEIGLRLKHSKDEIG